MFNLAGTFSNLVSYYLILDLGTKHSVIQIQEPEIYSKTFHRLGELTSSFLCSLCANWSYGTGIAPFSDLNLFSFKRGCIYA